ncbi:YdcF family protein [uncultured Clostridium sp.]|uniref:YdcF family protein n=1 Tax=uncultured Clostridium sp. TaxID=59620 RepID=UPI0028EC794D|nr:YdcF family protein [uncultured Clostridium sp.]
MNEVQKEMDANILIILLKYMAISVFIFIIILVLINLYPLLLYKSPATKLKRDRFDVIIILGFPVLQDGKPSPIMRERVIKAVELFNKGYANNIICSGGGVYNKYIEADIMANFAESLGIPNSCLIKEDKSRNTYQMEKSDYPKEFSYLYIIAIYMWENYVMTKTKIKRH